MFLTNDLKFQRSCKQHWGLARYAMELAYFHIRNFEKTYGKGSFVSLPCKRRACLFCAIISLSPRIQIPITIALKCYMLQCNLKSLCHNSSTALFPLNQPQTLVTNQRKAMMQYKSFKILDITVNTLPFLRVKFQVLAILLAFVCKYFSFFPTLLINAQNALYHCDKGLDQRVLAQFF